MKQQAAGASGLQEFRRAWRPLIASSVGLGLGLSPIPPYASGIMASALEAQFAWPRADILGTLMIVPVALVLLGRFVGRLVDRVGARKVAIVSTAGLGLAQSLIALIGTTLPGFYIAWAIMAVVALGTLPMTYAKVINGWFVQARGMALGISLAATGLTGAFLPFALTEAVAQIGWRGGYLVLAALPLLVALPLLLAWLREAPAAAAGDAAAAGGGAGLSVAAALRGYRFWTLAAASMALAFGVSGLLPNLYPLLLERGLDQGLVTRALAALALSVTGGRILSGFLLDRLWAPIVCAILVLPAVVALALLASPGISPAIIVAAVVTLGLVAGAEFDLIAFMTSRYFGQRHFSEIYGMQYAAFGLGAGFAPSTFGALRDRLGSYDPTLWLSICLLLTGTALNFTLGRYPRRFDAQGESGAPANAGLTRAEAA
ncbi:MFS transporter [Croceibacterium ferulae]|uniref:MFS transporter n=1 Tax=Croceibacterium ferulae TaxID=1854641 RepID=UPI00138FDFEA|nr:MFS transporter [Croceibacterium ferulae]